MACDQHVAANWDLLSPYAQSDGSWTQASLDAASDAGDLQALSPIQTAIDDGCNLTDGVAITNPQVDVTTQDAGGITVSTTASLPPGASPADVELTLYADGGRKTDKTVGMTASAQTFTFQEVYVTTGDQHEICVEATSVSV